jgi:hypothetical protein
MGISNDGAALTSDEQRLLARLEDRAGRDNPRLHTALTVGSRRVRLRSRRAGDVAAVLLLLAGTALMISTFAIWPLGGVLGVVIQAVALWLVVSRWGRPVVYRVQEWCNNHRQLTDPSSRPARR